MDRNDQIKFRTGLDHGGCQVHWLKTLMDLRKIGGRCPPNDRIIRTLYIKKGIEFCLTFHLKAKPDI